MVGVVALEEDIPGVSSRVLNGLKSEVCIFLLMFLLLPFLLVLCK